MTKVLILGTTGMLGSCMSRVLSESSIEVVEANRSGKPVSKNNSIIQYDLLSDASLESKFGNLKFDYIFNSIGLIKQLINESIPEQIELARKINTEFPIQLDEYAFKHNIKVLQIGTDCVYSGKHGNYDEKSNFDASDVYGKTKAEGELHLKNTMSLRTSIIGNELNSNMSLLNWFTSQPKNGKVSGYSNHIWNGITTLAFSKIVRGVIETNSFFEGTTHVVPEDMVSKLELLRIIGVCFNREDISIEETAATESINRTLSTQNSTLNSRLWSDAGYNSIPTIRELVAEYADWLRSE